MAAGLRATPPRPRTRPPMAPRLRPPPTLEHRTCALRRPTATPAPPRPDAPLAPCDFDGDGLSDLALFEPAAGMWHVAASSSGSVDANNWGWDAVDPVPAEYDGDGRFERVVYYAPEGQWFISSSVGGWVGDEPVTVGPPGAFPAPADYDRDGLAELAVYDPTSLAREQVRRRADARL